MKKITRLTEKDLTRIVKKVIKENDMELSNDKPKSNRFFNAPNILFTRIDIEEGVANRIMDMLSEYPDVDLEKIQEEDLNNLIDSITEDICDVIENHFNDMMDNELDGIIEDNYDFQDFLDKHVNG